MGIDDQALKIGRIRSENEMIPEEDKAIIALADIATDANDFKELVEALCLQTALERQRHILKSAI